MTACSVTETPPRARPSLAENAAKSKVYVIAGDVDHEGTPQHMAPSSEYGPTGRCHPDRDPPARQKNRSGTIRVSSGRTRSVALTFFSTLFPLRMRTTFVRPAEPRSVAPPASVSAW